MKSDPESKDPPALLAGGRIVGGLAGSPFGPLGALAGVEAGEMAARMIAATMSRRERRAERLLNEAMKRSGLPSNDFEARLTSTDEHAEVFGRTMEAGARAIATEKVYALADVLAAAAVTEEPADLDLHLLYADALADIEAPHLALLDYLYPDSPRLPLDEFPRHHQALRYSTADLKQRTRVAKIHNRGLPHLANGMEGLLATLQRHGLVVLHAPDLKDKLEKIEKMQRRSLADGYPQEQWSITELGISLLEFIQQANDFLDGTERPALRITSLRRSSEPCHAHHASGLRQGRR